MNTHLQPQYTEKVTLEKAKSTKNSKRKREDELNDNNNSKRGSKGFFRPWCDNNQYKTVKTPTNSSIDKAAEVLRDVKPNSAVSLNPLVMAPNYLAFQQQAAYNMALQQVMYQRHLDYYWLQKQHQQQYRHQLMLHLQAQYTQQQQRLR